MSDSEDSTVTYTAVSIHLRMGQTLVHQVPPSLDYIPSPEEPQSPPLLDFVPEPMYPEYMPQEDEILPAEEQPLPAAALPTADSPGYVPESDLEEEPEEDNEDPEEDPTNYIADRYDDDDEEEEEEPSRDDANDEDEDDDEDEDEEEEEEHPTPADSVLLVHRMTARISIQDEPSISLPPREELLSSDYKTDRPEIILPPRKRLGVDLGPRGDLYGFVYMVDVALGHPMSRELDYGITDTWDDLRERLRWLVRLGDYPWMLANYEQPDEFITTTVVAQSALNSEVTVSEITGDRGLISIIGRSNTNSRLLRECTYPDFLKCQPLNFKGIEGVVGLTQWFKKMESVYSISNCTVACQVKFATCTLQGNALTWWNSHVKTTTPEAAHAMPWRTLKKMMTDKYCPRGEIKKLEFKMWNLKLKGSNML
ncbi:putative reverse transcriptase domain-containing protein [Tanacetum coccineum]